MIALPRALAGWEQELACLPADLGSALAPMLGRLRAALGPLRSRAGDDGEPDGYSALARRGPMERLVVSQWALLDEAPDELLRRASSGELLFVDLARRTPHVDRRVVVLFDAGPAQLGAPRIAHLALLLVMARRAREAGATLAWGVLGRPADGLRALVDEPAIEALLAARSALAPTTAQLESWAEHTPLERGSEPWIVSDGALAARAPSAWSRVIVEDPLDPERRALDVAIVRRRRPPIAVELALPDERTCSRLLRAPFAGRQAAPARADRASPALHPETQLAFTPDGQRLLARTARGGVAVFGLGGSASTPRTLELPPGWSLLAAGVDGRRIVVVAADEQGRLRARGVAAQADRWQTIAHGAGSLLAMPERLDPAFYGPCTAIGNALLFVSGGALFQVRHPGHAEPRSELLCDGVSRLAPRRQRHMGLAIVRETEAAIEVLTDAADGSRPTVLRTFARAPETGAPVLGSGHDGQAQLGVCMGPRELALVELTTRATPSKIPVEDASRVVGVVSWWREGQQGLSGAVAQSADARGLVVVTHHGPASSVRLPASIAHVAPCTTQRRIAVALTDGTIHVLSLPGLETVSRIPIAGAQ